MLDSLVEGLGTDRPRPDPSRTMFAAMTSRDGKACGQFAKDIVDLFQRTATDDREAIVEALVEPIEKLEQGAVGANLVRTLGEVEQRSVKVKEQAGGSQKIT